MWYTPVSGIWQSVWIEAVPRKGRIQELRITPSLDQVEILAAADSEELTIAIGGEGIEKPFVMTAAGLPGLLHMRGRGAPVWKRRAAKIRISPWWDSDSGFAWRIPVFLCITGRREHPYCIR